MMQGGVVVAGGAEDITTRQKLGATVGVVAAEGVVHLHPLTGVDASVLVAAPQTHLVAEAVDAGSLKTIRRLTCEST